VECIRQAIAARGAANVIVATDASQFEMLKNLVEHKDIPWNKMIAFHLDKPAASLLPR